MPRTPGPYEVNGPYIRLTDASKAVVAHMLTLHGEKEANAEFIVRACNMHDDLVEALEQAIHYAESDSTCSICHWDHGGRGHKGNCEVPDWIDLRDRVVV